MNHQDLSPLDQIKLRTGMDVRGISPKDQSRINQILEGEGLAIPHPMFKLENAYENIIVKEDTPMLPENKPREDINYALIGYTNETFSIEEEKTLFLKYNFCRSKKKDLWKKGHKLTLEERKELLYWDSQAKHYEEIIVRYNLGLISCMVLRKAHKFILDHDEAFAAGSDGYFRSIELFDISRGYKFSTYACRAISQKLQKANKDKLRRVSNEPHELDVTWQTPIDKSPSEELLLATVREIIRDKNIKNITTRDWTILECRFLKEPTLTLKQTGRVVGLNKEIVRQCQNRALQRIRVYIEIHYFKNPSILKEEEKKKKKKKKKISKRKYSKNL